ncbi:MAG: hypothetical protein L0H96_19330 [Humibacillus sp.]|nr:hypothetical protein [Humibacillus sp.]MDN5779051.1 hypothetical protein [Humibacillus sp.]
MSSTDVTWLDASDVAYATHGRNRTYLIPDVVSDRLDELLQIMGAGGFRAERADLVGALIFGAPSEADDLQRLVQSYRTATVQQVSLQDPTKSGRVKVQPAVQGPRKRRR